jgi:hypothetical protein
MFHPALAGPLDQRLFRDLAGSRHAVSSTFSLILVASLLLGGCATAADFDDEYGQGDEISPAIFVANKAGSRISLASLLGAETGVNVLFIFGGGDLGAGMPGHLWCQDSFEDTAILRTLYGQYENRGVNFIAVASAPVYHSQALGHKAGVFLIDSDDSDEYKNAEQDFIDSTEAAVDNGILPFEPYFDARFRLSFNRRPDLVPREAYGEVYPWQGVFRSPTETQFYGVPSFWILDNAGRVLTAPFRGNVYHPHDTDPVIRYTYRDIDAALDALLQPR